MNTSPSGLFELDPIVGGQQFCFWYLRCLLDLFIPFEVTERVHIWVNSGSIPGGVAGSYMSIYGFGTLLKVTSAVLWKISGTFLTTR